VTSIRAQRFFQIALRRRLVELLNRTDEHGGAGPSPARDC